MLTRTSAGRSTVDRAIRYDATHFGDRTFLEWTGGVATYAELDAAVSSFACALRAVGVRRGDRVLVQLPNNLHHLVVLFGVHRAGAVYVACSTLYPRDEIAYQLLHSESAAAVCTTAMAPVLQSIADDAGRPMTVLTADDGTDSGVGTDVASLLATHAGEWSEPPPEPDELATIIYTSGTTARPKGVMWTHGQFHRCGRRGVETYGYRPDERVLHFFPLYHSNGGAFLLAPSILVGSTIVMEPRFSASRFAETIATRGITHVHLNATHVKMIMAQPPSRFDRHHAVGKAQFALHLEPETRVAFTERFGIRLCELYGMTETLGVCVASPVWANHTESAGLPMSGVQLRIVDDNGIDLPANEKGEILVRTDTPEGLCAGYFRDEAATAELFRDGWLHTGDVGFTDDDGYLHFVERKKDMIKRSGYNVAPAEVERVLLEHRSVGEAAVVGIPDAMREEAIVGFVIASKDCAVSADELLQFCAERLAPYKSPQHVAVLEALPLNFLGKLEKRRLRDLALEMFGD